MKFKLPLLLLLSLMWQAVSSADEWANIATAVTVTEGRLCAGELAADGTGTDILCDDDHPAIDSSGNVTVSGELSATILNATQLCDEDGANCTDLSGGLSGVSSLASLTDVNVSNPPEGAALQWDNNSSRWIAGSVIDGGCSPSESDIMPAMSSLTASGYTVSASSQYSGSYPAWRAFDNIIDGNGWVGASGVFPSWLQIEMPLSRKVVAYTITARSHDNHGPLSWTFEGSTDSSTWSVLHTGAETDWNSNQSRAYSITSPTSYLFYRLNVASDQNNYVNIGELELYTESCSGADDLGNHTASQNLNMSTFDIIGTGDISVTTLNATQLCDENGANCTTLSGGLSSVSALVSLTDVSATAPTDGQLLSYDASENEWVATDVISKTIILNSADDNPCVVTGGVRKLSFNPTTGRLRVCRP